MADSLSNKAALPYVAKTLQQANTAPKGFKQGYADPPAPGKVRPGQLGTPDAGAVDFARKRGSQRITQISETTRYGVRKRIAEAIEQGMSPAEAGAYVRSWSGFDEYRAERIARTEMMEAYNDAAIKSYEGVGVKQVVADDGDKDEECAARHGNVYSLEDASAIHDHPNGTLDWLPVAPDMTARAAQEELRQVRDFEEGRLVSIPTPKVPAEDIDWPVLMHAAKVDQSLLTAHAENLGWDEDELRAKVAEFTKVTQQANLKQLTPGHLDNMAQQLDWATMSDIPNLLTNWAEVHNVNAQELRAAIEARKLQKVQQAQNLAAIPEDQIAKLAETWQSGQMSSNTIEALAKTFDVDQLAFTEKLKDTAQLIKVQQANLQALSQSQLDSFAAVFDASINASMTEAQKRAVVKIWAEQPHLNVNPDALYDAIQAHKLKQQAAQQLKVTQQQNLINISGSDMESLAKQWRHAMSSDAELDAIAASLNVDRFALRIEMQSKNLSTLQSSGKMDQLAAQWAGTTPNWPEMAAKYGVDESDLISAIGKSQAKQGMAYTPQGVKVPQGMAADELNMMADALGNTYSESDFNDVWDQWTTYGISGKPDPAELWAALQKQSQAMGYPASQYTPKVLMPAAPPVAPQAGKYVTGLPESELDDMIAQLKATPGYEHLGLKKQWASNHGLPLDDLLNDIDARKLARGMKLPGKGKPKLSKANKKWDPSKYQPTRYPSLDDMGKSLKRWSDPHIAAHRQSKDLLYDYTNSYYTEVNPVLRSKPEVRHWSQTRVQQAKANVRTMVEGLQPLPEDMDLFRFTSADSALGLPKGASHADIMARLQPGHHIVDDAFMSTSINRNWSWNGNLKLNIKAPKGSTKGVYAQSFSTHTSEWEVILEPGTRLVIDSVNVIDNGYSRVYHVEAHVG